MGNAFNSAASVHKVFARLATWGHQEPRTAKGGQLGEMTSYFLSGHVNLNDEHKARIYGTGPSTLCGGSIKVAGPASENCVVCEKSSSCPKLTPPSSRQGLGDFLRKGGGQERDSACMCGSSACVCPRAGRCGLPRVQSHSLLPGRVRLQRRLDPKVFVPSGLSVQLRVPIVRVGRPWTMEPPLK